MLNKKIKIFVRFLFGILFFNSVFVFSPQQIYNTSIKIVPDSSVSSYNSTDEGLSNDSTKTVSDSMKYRKPINKILSPASSTLTSEGSTIKGTVNTLKPDSTTNGKIISKITPISSAKLSPDSSAKKN